MITTNKQRKNEILIAGIKYKFKIISHSNLFGLKKIWSSNIPALIADIHKTIIDVLDDPTLGGGGRQTVDICQEYFQHHNHDPKISCAYAEKLGYGSVFKRLGFLAE